jgi:hypothetical protein
MCGQIRQYDRGESVQMIRQDGSIQFGEELMSLVDRFVEDYEDIVGELQSDLERGLVITYVLSALRCDLELLADCLGAQQVFGGMPPQRVLEECSDKDPGGQAERRAEILRWLHQRGWLPLSAS